VLDEIRATVPAIETSSAIIARSLTDPVAALAYKPTQAPAKAQGALRRSFAIDRVDRIDPAGPPGRDSGGGSDDHRQ
jgi:hypothetical protein